MTLPDSEKPASGPPVGHNGAIPGSPGLDPPPAFNPRNLRHGAHTSTRRAGLVLSVLRKRHGHLYTAAKEQRQALEDAVLAARGVLTVEDHYAVEEVVLLSMALRLAQRAAVADDPALADRAVARLLYALGRRTSALRRLGLVAGEVPGEASADGLGGELGNLLAGLADGTSQGDGEGSV